MMVRLLRISASASGVISIRAPWRATATTSSKDSGPMPTAIAATSESSWVVERWADVMSSLDPTGDRSTIPDPWLMSRIRDIRKPAQERQRAACQDAGKAAVLLIVLLFLLPT